MKRVGLLVVAVVVMLGIWPAGTTGQAQTYTIDVEVLFRPPLDDAPVTGDPCGYDLLTLAYDGMWPPAAQVVITDASGVVVGTIDLMDASAVVAQWADAKPGVYIDDGVCQVKQSVEVTASPFYTFTVDGRYHWTVSTERLESLDWQWQVVFL